MEPTGILEISREAVFVLLKVSMPILLITLSVGLIISLFQALTQIQENTLSFVPKVVAVLFALIIFTPSIVNTLKVFTEHISSLIINID
jgi:flagellar biosynthetic protein FliQ